MDKASILAQLEALQISPLETIEHAKAMTSAEQVFTASSPALHPFTHLRVLGLKCISTSSQGAALAGVEGILTKNLLLKVGSLSLAADASPPPTA
jgi:hypothetical protein